MLVLALHKSPSTARVINLKPLCPRFWCPRSGTTASTTLLPTPTFSPSVSLLSQNSTAIPLASIVVNAPSTPTSIMPSRGAPGSTPSNIPKAPGLPDSTYVLNFVLRRKIITFPPFCPSLIPFSPTSLPSEPDPMITRPSPSWYEPAAAALPRHRPLPRFIQHRHTRNRVHHDASGDPPCPRCHGRSRLGVLVSRRRRRRRQQRGARHRPTAPILAFLAPAPLHARRRVHARPTSSIGAIDVAWHARTLRLPPCDFQRPRTPAVVAPLASRDDQVQPPRAAGKRSRECSVAPRYAGTHTTVGSTAGSTTSRGFRPPCGSSCCSCPAVRRCTQRPDYHYRLERGVVGPSCKVSGGDLEKPAFKVQGTQYACDRAHAKCRYETLACAEQVSVSYASLLGVERSEWM